MGESSHQVWRKQNGRRLPLSSISSFVSAFHSFLSVVAVSIPALEAFLTAATKKELFSSLSSPY